MFERIIEYLLFASRWLLAPIYLLLAALLLLVVFKMGQELIVLFMTILSISKMDLILATLSLIDLALVANLLSIVILSSYETFVSRIDLSEGQEKPAWLGKIDAGLVKMKLAISIVAISAIHLLGIYMNLGETSHSEAQLRWYVIIHLILVVTALLLAWIDRLIFAKHRA